jgi:putative flippase GtrA
VRYAPHFLQFQKFVLVGGLATATQYAVLVAMVRLLGANPVFASSCGYVISALLNYYLNYRLTFRSVQSHRRALPRFGAIAVVGLLINSTIVWALSEHGPLPYLAAQIVATAVVLLWNFGANRKWTF